MVGRTVLRMREAVRASRERTVVVRVGGIIEVIERDERVRCNTEVYRLWNVLH